MNYYCMALLTLLMFSLSAQAKLTIKNEDTAAVEVTVYPEAGNIIKNDFEKRRTINPGEKVVMDVKKEEMGNHEYISVIGKVTMPSLYNKCRDLVVSKDYDIVFVPGKAGGVVCHVQETLKDKN